MKGFTLIEIIIATAIGVSVGIILIGVLSNHTGFYYKQSTLVSEGISLNDVMQEMSSTIKQASQIVAEYPSGSPLYTTDSDTIVLKLPALSETGTITNVYDYVVIEPDSSHPSVLRFKVFPDPQSIRVVSDKVLTTLLDSISFTYLDSSGNIIEPNQAVQIDINLTVVSNPVTIDSDSKQSVNTRVILRNF